MFYVLFQVVLISSLMVAMVIAQQRPVPPQFSRSGAGRGAAARLELEPQQTVPQPFRRVSLPLYRGRGFSLQDGQDQKSIPAITQLPPFQPRPAGDNNNNNNNNELNRVGDVDDETAVDALPQTVRSSQVPQQQAERTQQTQQFDRTQQQPEKQFNSFRPQVCRSGFSTDFQGVSHNHVIRMKCKSHESHIRYPFLLNVVC